MNVLRGTPTNKTLAKTCESDSSAKKSTFHEQDSRNKFCDSVRHVTNENQRLTTAEFLKFALLQLRDCRYADCLLHVDDQSATAF